METDHTVVERRVLEKALSPAAVVLDAGCGRTTRLRFYRDRIARLVGVDNDLEAGRENPYLDEFVAADLEDRLPFDDQSFDLVYANFVVEHLRRPELVFAEWSRVLRPGGRLVLVTSNRASPLMAVAVRIPRRARLTIKRHGAGAVERDVYPTRYLANSAARLAQLAESVGLRAVSIEFVATAHRYAARLPGAGVLLKALERVLPASRRSTIVASYRRPPAVRKL